MGTLPHVYSEVEPFEGWKQALTVTRMVIQPERL